MFYNLNKIKSSNELIKAVESSHPFSGPTCPAELSSTRPTIKADTIPVNCFAETILTLD